MTKQTTTDNVTITGTMETEVGKPVLTLKELYANIIKLQAEVTIMKNAGRKDALKFNLWAILVVLLQILNIFVHRHP